MQTSTFHTAQPVVFCDGSNRELIQKQLPPTPGACGSAALETLTSLSQGSECKDTETSVVQKKNPGPEVSQSLVRGKHTAPVLRFGGIFIRTQQGHPQNVVQGGLFCPQTALRRPSSLLSSVLSGPPSSPQPRDFDFQVWKLHLRILCEVAEAMCSGWIRIGLIHKLPDRLFYKEFCENAFREAVADNVLVLAASAMLSR
ncbi:hypothetical protein MG293_017039 [Ovis ammon polii]|uniref:Uncharacterized protein n=1 Tax=Ovis ammon polii TaxID=230172 RepID=A0AAD4Y433_OVIAM|nr:hypothetical protein MG293_017039 [Ovis ammon polii]